MRLAPLGEAVVDSRAKDIQPSILQFGIGLVTLDHLIWPRTQRIFIGPGLRGGAEWCRENGASDAFEHAKIDLRAEIGIAGANLAISPQAMALTKARVDQTRGC